MAATRSPAANLGCGVTSFTRRCRVQFPPFSTLVGTPGRGMIEPKLPVPPVKLNAVT